LLLEFHLRPALALLLLAASVLAAWRRHREAWGRLVVEHVLAAGLGGVPAALCFHTAKENNPIGAVILVELGLCAGTLMGGTAPVLAAYIMARPQRPATGLGTALVGAFAGTVLALVVIAGPEWTREIPAHLYALAIALVGSFAVLGYQLGAGAPVPRIAPGSPGGGRRGPPSPAA
jgi:hypothetical protein